MSIGKVLGFLGLTSDVTGFELDPNIIAFGLVISVVIQLLKDNTEVDIEYKDGKDKVRFSNTK